MDYDIDLKDEIGSYQPHTSTQPPIQNYNQQHYETEQPTPQQNIQPERTGAQTGCTKFCNLQFYEHYFQVSQNEVLNRIKMSIIPIKKQFIEKIRPNPDFYGPFWILTTIIFLLGSAGNLSNYLHNWSNNGFTFDLSLIRIGVVVVYPFGFGVPTLLYFVLKFTGGQRLSLPQVSLYQSQLICIYGYSFSLFVVILILCVIPWTVLQWLLMVGGMLGTIAFLIMNLMEYLDDVVQAKRFVFFGIVGAAQITLFLVFKLVFFGMVYAAEVNP